MIIRPKFFRFQHALIINRLYIIRNNILFAWGSVMHALAILYCACIIIIAGLGNIGQVLIAYIVKILFLDLCTILMMCLHINSVSQNEHHCKYTIIIIQLQMLRQKKSDTMTAG